MGGSFSSERYFLPDVDWSRCLSSAPGREEEGGLIVFSIKTLAMATAVSAGVVFAMPTTSQAMPQTAPIKVDVAKDSNIVDVRHRKWHRGKKWVRYCRNHWDPVRCGHRSARVYRYRYYDDYDPYPYYGYYRPRYYSPGIGLHFDID
jgi:hypothetical protein